MAVEIVNESGVDADELGLVMLTRWVLAERGVHPLVEVALRLVDEEQMTYLHEKFMDEPGPTDVLSFPMDELDTSRNPGAELAPDEILLGDVVLCPSVAQRQAAAAGHSTAAELELLCTHGVLHLLGYDHAEPAEQAEMFGLQQRLLVGWRERAAQDV